MKSRKVKAAAKSKAFMSKKKLKGNIPLSTFSESDADVDSDDLLYDDRNKKIEELSTDDEDLIQRREDSSEEEEVLPITDDEKEDWENEGYDDVNEEGDSEEDEEQGLPNRDAWGKKKSAYYHADFVDQDRGKTYREEDAEKAKAEEEEALFMQRNFRSYIGDSALDVPELEAADLENEQPVAENLKLLDKEGKLKYLKKKCPELFVFINEFKEKLSEIKDRLVPMLKLVKSGTIQSESGAHYIKLRYQLLLHYCMNISFYMYLKSNGSVTTNHPVLQRINMYKKLVEQMSNVSENADKEIDIILEKLQQNEKIEFINIEPNIQKVHPQTERRKVQDRYRNGEMLEESGAEDQEMDVDFDPTGEKRTITYQIAKNKGLVPKRKKEYRNPRVHNRMKYKKAKIRRKGQVRDVVREVKRYDGERTGISTHVVRSIKMK